MPGKILIKGKLPINFKYDKDIDQFIASCPIFDVVTQGKDQAEAKVNLQKALQLFLNSCYEHSTLTQVMKESGFVPGMREFNSKFENEDQQQYIEVQTQLYSLR